MSQDSIIRMAREAGWSGIYTQWREPDGSPDWTPVKDSLTVPVTMEQIERFAALVAAAEREKVRSSMKKAFRRMAGLIRADEREACAKVCEAYTDNDGGTFIDHEGHGYACAAAIRARGETK